MGSANINKVFGLPPTFVTWDSKVTSTQKTIRGTPMLWKIQNYDMDSGSTPSSLICTICEAEFLKVTISLSCHGAKFYWVWENSLDLYTQTRKVMHLYDCHIFLVFFKTSFIWLFGIFSAKMSKLKFWQRTQIYFKNVWCEALVKWGSLVGRKPS